MRWSVLLACLTLDSALATEDVESMNLEQSVCGLKEPVLFWLWSRAAGAPDEHRLAALAGVDDIAQATRDGRVLRGYRLNARSEDNNKSRRAKGYLLVLQGNAILADHLLVEFVRYARAGFDVYIYDYRGYGRSGGKRRLKAMVSDVGEIITALNANGYARKLVYAFSFGGILLLDAYQVDFGLDRIVIDSSPSRLSDYGCPAEYDPIAHLPDDCRNFLFITGQQDTVVTPAMSLAMVAQAKQCGARTYSGDTLGHPFMDPGPAEHQQRMELIAEFLLEGDSR
jgi:alpha/beta superfamily hydrolase